ncbi:MAG: DUF452 family protein [Bacteroidales bacterium]|nr:DUF452 family protein [Bacteroidales bacterium]
MLGGHQAVKDSAHLLPKRTVEDQTDELEFLRKDIEANKGMSATVHVAMVGRDDLIFPFQNQKKYWQGQAMVKELDMPHYPFLHFNTWQEIIETLNEQA